MADLYLKKQNLETDIFFDTVVENNDILKDDSYLSASLISIFTDASKHQIGIFIDGGELGNKYYNLNKLSKEAIKENEDGLRDALQWLIDDGIVKEISISSLKYGNRLDRTITFTTNNETQDNLMYSLDENIGILD